MKKKKCWVCRKDIKDDGRLYCKKCEKADKKPTAGTLIIYNMV